MNELAIRIEGLTKYYRTSLFSLSSVPALDHLNLQVPRGTVFGFLGPNGAGKTTTIRCLMDLIRPSEGRAWVLNEPCGNVRVRGRIGYLPDSPAFSGFLTARQFLNLCARLLRIPKARRRSKIDEVLEVVRMTPYADNKLGGFSRGMIQRIGIAQSILNEPELLILDEPLVGLDPEGRRELLDIVAEQKQRGVCVFFCSHILSDVEKLCDSVAILCKGKLVTTGALQDLLASRGTIVAIPASEESVAKELMLEADDIHKREDGGWKLEFHDEAKCARLRERSLPESIHLAPIKESLDDLFFRSVRPIDPEGARDVVQTTEASSDS
jgi:ABC-2 type transport system ATP-binding protein